MLWRSASEMPWANASMGAMTADAARRRIRRGLELVIDDIPCLDKDWVDFGCKKWTSSHGAGCLCYCTALEKKAGVMLDRVVKAVLDSSLTPQPARLCNSCPKLRL